MTPSLRFRVENLGPIRRGEIELRPLTLLIGKNNTGKTYAAQAIHAAHKALDGAASAEPGILLEATDVPMLEAFLRRLRLAQDDKHEKLVKRSLFGAGQDEDASQTRPPLPPQLETKAKQWLEHLFDDASRRLPGRMKAYFSVPDLSKITSWDTRSLCSITVQRRSDSKTAHLFGTMRRNPDLDIINPPLSEERISELSSTMRFYETRRRSGDDDFHLYEYTRTFAHAVRRDYLEFAGFGASSYYMPSGRSGLLQAWTDVVRMKLQLDRERFGLEPDHSISLGGVALDFLSEFQSLFSPRQRYYRGFKDDFPGALPLTSALELLERTLGGSIAVDSKPNEIPALIYKQGSNPIPVQRASSMVADLAPLAIWTRELVRPGDLLIIDEPESHLHPEAVRLVARALVRLANAGVKVLCTTHSSVLLHQISNCMLSANAPNVDKDLSPEDGIAHTDIGVFRFRHVRDEGGVLISQVKIDPDWGIPEDEYVDIADDLTHQTASLISATQS